MSEQDVFDSAEGLLGRFDFATQLAEVERLQRERLQVIFTSFIEVMDSFDRLFADMASSTSSDESPSPKTVQLIARQLESALRKGGATHIACLNLPFDPEKHKVIEVKPVPGVPQDTIVQEVFKGYELEGEILRFPLVVIAGGQQSQNPKEDQNDGIHRD